MLGNGWEWTATAFAGFDGFSPRPYYPGYSANFFDGAHFVMKGASPRTARAAGAAVIPQLVPRRVSLRLRDGAAGRAD